MELIPRRASAIPRGQENRATQGRTLRRLKSPHEHPLTLFGDEFCPGFQDD